MAASKKKKLAKVLPWQKQLAVHAKEGKTAKEKPMTADRISTKGSKFTLGKAKLGQEIDCVIVAYCFENSWFEGAYSDSEKNSVSCFALGYDEDSLKPDKISPNIQSKTCEDCELNEWGSADTGEGKACGNRRRLALVVDADTGKPEIKTLNLAPTDLANWKKFISDVESQGLHTMQCAVNISFDEDSTAPRAPLVFDFVKEITKEKTLQALAGTLEQANKMLEQPYDVSNYKKAKGKKAGKKKAAKKKGKKRSKFS